MRAGYRSTRTGRDNIKQEGRERERRRAWMLEDCSPAMPRACDLEGCRSTLHCRSCTPQGDGVRIGRTSRFVEPEVLWSDWGNGRALLLAQREMGPSAPPCVGGVP